MGHVALKGNVSACRRSAGDHVDGQPSGAQDRGDLVLARSSTIATIRWTSM